MFLLRVMDTCVTRQHLVPLGIDPGRRRDYIDPMKRRKKRFWKVRRQQGRCGARPQVAGSFQPQQADNYGNYPSRFSFPERKYLDLLSGIEL
jgi:hypothetical protein